MSIGTVIVTCFALVGGTIIIVAITKEITHCINDIKREEIESNRQVADKAMSNEVARVKIHDIKLDIPWKTEKEIKEADGEEALRWYRKGFQDGSSSVKEEAKRILSRM